MAFHVHRSARADRLVEALAGLLADPLDDAMVAEVVSVPTRGVERWVAQRLSATLGASAGRADGVCANIEFPFPGRLVNEAVDAATPGPVDPEIWRPERMVWPLMDVAEASLDEAWLAPLVGYIGSAEPARATAAPAGGTDRRFGAVRHVADLFDRYAVHRPGMLRAWAEGIDVGGDGAALPDDCVWQAQLWRKLRARLGTPSPAERLTAACERLVADPSLVALPTRVCLFGLTRIPASHVEVLRALAVDRDVHLLALHPSPALWAEIAARPASRRPTRRRDDTTAQLPRHPLLASWGRDAREMQLVLTAPAAGGEPIDHYYPVETEPVTLLARIQADLRADRPPPGPPAAGRPDQRPRLDPDDRSLQVHDCHGTARQVEVLRDAILHLLRHDPSLEPRDIVVMCPDIDTFAPLIHATFDSGTSGFDRGQTPGADGAIGSFAAPLAADRPANDAQFAPPGDLRVRLADRSLRQTNPILAVVSELLTLAEARLTASQVLDLAGRQPVRQRFDLDDDDLDRLEQWVAAAGIRWGLDGAHRAPYGLEGLEANTWHAGLDRLLLGAAMTEDDHPLVGGVLPLDDVGSGDLELVGQLTELVTRLGAALDRLAGPQALPAWIDAIADGTRSLTATTDDDEWQPRELKQLLDDLLAEAGSPVAQPVLSLAEIRTLIADRLRGHPTRANFRTGHLTVCTLVPMRSVPHRVVCLLGLDDGVFPRNSPSDGDDLIERLPFVGDRDGRSEDRQLLLDALLAATDHIVITYSGRDERTNARRPPAVPLGELLDVADATCRVEGPYASPAVPAGATSPLERQPVRRQISTVHPLQPFDPRNFTAGALTPSPWSFDPVYLAGARALRGERSSAASFLGAPLPPSRPGPVELDSLIRFLRHPVQAFLRQRLGIALADRSTDPDDALSIELDALQRWKVGDRLLQSRLSGADPGSVRAAEVARGELPPGALGEEAIARVAPIVEQLVVEAARHPEPPHPARSGAIDVAVDLGDGNSVVGTVTGLINSTARAVTFSRVRPDLRLAAWVRLLVLTATEPSVPWDVVTIGQRSGRVEVASVGPLPGDDGQRLEAALAHLRALVDLFRRGMSEPAPLYMATSAAFATARRAGRDPVAAGRKEWATTKDDWLKEDSDPYHVLVLGGVVDLDDLLADEPRPDELGAPWPGGESSRFGRYAVRLWTGLLALERMATP
jgi:exodeoxyribonuclease V gamma subunit